MNVPSLALRLLFPGLMAMLLSGTARSQEADAKPEVAEQPPVEQVLGTWLKTRVNIDGDRVTERLVIESTGSKGEFHFSYEQRSQDSGEVSSGEGDGLIIAGGRQYVVMDVDRMRVLKPEDEATDWEETPFSIAAQIIGDRMHSTPGMDLEGGVWTREGSSTPIVTADKLKALAPLLGTYTGEHEDPGSKGYGIAAGTSQIVSTHRLSPSGKLVIGEWSNTPAGGTADDTFEVRAVCSYSPTEKSIIVDYHTSTGVSMHGKIVAMDEGKMLWERKGNSPEGAIHEYCLFDFSEPGTFAHTIVHRTVDGIPAEGEEGVTITLKKQD